jgi:hypothetical protein
VKEAQTLSRTLKVRGGIISQANRYLGGFCSSQRIFPPQIIQVLLLVLDQLLFEGLERSYFKTKAESLECTVDHGWNALRFIKEILVKAGVDPNEIDAIVNPLQELHSLRSKMKGHASGQEAKKIRIRLITPTTTSLFDIRVTTRYVAPAYPREQQEAAYVPSLSDRW